MNPVEKIRMKKQTVDYAKQKGGNKRSNVVNKHTKITAEETPTVHIS